MRKRRSLLLPLSGVIMISFLLPSYFWLRDYFSHTAFLIDSAALVELAIILSFIVAFWSCLLNLALMVIAYKAYRNFDVKKQFHNKQLELVSELATDITSTHLSNMMYRISIDPDGEEHQIATGFTLSFFELSLGFDYSGYQMIVVKGNNLEKTFPFLKYKNHPLLPKSIASELKKFYQPLQYSYSIGKKDLPKNYVVLYGAATSLEGPDAHKWLYKLYDVPTDFRKDARALRTAITSWLGEYGAENLNF